MSVCVWGRESVGTPGICQSQSWIDGWWKSEELLGGIMVGISAVCVTEHFPFIDTNTHTHPDSHTHKHTTHTHTHTERDRKKERRREGETDRKREREKERKKERKKEKPAEAI